MSETVVGRAGEHIAETARTASRLTSAMAEAVEEGLGGARRVAKQAGDAAEEFFGKKRLKSAVAQAARLDCAGMHDAVQEALKAFTGGAEQSDDITLVVAEYNGPQE